MSLFGFNPNGNVPVSGLAGPRRGGTTPAADGGASGGLFFLRGDKQPEGTPSSSGVAAVGEKRPADVGQEYNALLSLAAGSVAEERNEWNSEDEDVDEFGRKKKRKVQAVSKAQAKAQAPAAVTLQTDTRGTATSSRPPGGSFSSRKALEKKREEEKREDSALRTNMALQKALAAQNVFAQAIAAREASGETVVEKGKGTRDPSSLDRGFGELGRSGLAGQPLASFSSSLGREALTMPSLGGMGVEASVADYIDPYAGLDIAAFTAAYQEAYLAQSKLQQGESAESTAFAMALAASKVAGVGAQGSMTSPAPLGGIGGGLPPQVSYKPLPGDWQCPECSDWQFARNQACRRCGTANPGLAGIGNKTVEPITPLDVEAFLAPHQITKQVADQLRSLPPFMQRCVVNRGNMAEAKNPTAVLRSRIRDVMVKYGQIPPA